MEWNKIVRNARERLGLTAHDVAIKLGISDPSYEDIESVPDELTLLYDLRDVFRLLEILDISLQDVLNLTQRVPERFDPSIDVTLENALRQSADLETLEDDVGYYLDPESCKPARALQEWNIELLEGLCSSLGIDFPSAILAYQELWRINRGKEKE